MGKDIECAEFDLGSGVLVLAGSTSRLGDDFEENANCNLGMADSGKGQSVEFGWACRCSTDCKSFAESGEEVTFALEDMPRSKALPSRLRLHEIVRSWSDLWA
jgi:hypothetical protein